MKFLYLDESGCLGFDFINKKPSIFFTITILAIDGIENNRKLLNAVKETLKRKFKKGARELKGNSTKIEIKQYFYQKVRNLPLEIYSITLNKKLLENDIKLNKSQIYNSISTQIIDQINFSNIKNRVEFIVDRSQTKTKMKEFDYYIKESLKLRLNKKVLIDIYHRNSTESFGLQAFDMFCSGIFSNYEKKKKDWLKIFEEKMKYNEINNAPNKLKPLY